MRFRWLSLVAVLLCAPSLYAAVPSEFSVQGILRDGSGQLQSMMVNVSISLFDDQNAGTKLAGPYGPTMVMATNGLFTFPVQDPALVSDLGSAAQVWLEVTVGADTFPRQLVTPQIFALMCGTADAVRGLTILPSGSVGVGTTAPNATFHVADSVNAQQIIATSSDAPGSQSYLFLDRTRGTPTAQTSVMDGDGIGRLYSRAFNAGAIRDATLIVSFVDGVPGATAVPASMVFETSDANGLSERMRITSQGHVGINYPSAPAQFSAVGSAGVTNGNWYDPVNYTGYFHHQVDQANANGVLISNVWRANTGFVFAVDGRLLVDGTIAGDTHTPYFIVRGDGAVGIGTANPGYKLDVVGDISSTTKVWANSVQLSSDARLKRDVKTIEHALDEVQRLRGVRFTWIKDGSPSIGVIAQEVEKVFPEIVSTRADGFKAVDYPKLAGVLIESTKELRAENAALRARLERIEARLDKRAAR